MLSIAIACNTHRVVAVKLYVFIVYMHVASMISCLTDCQDVVTIASLNVLSRIMREKSN